MAAVVEWNSLKRRARSAEVQLEEKLQEYAKVDSKMAAYSDFAGRRPSDAESGVAGGAHVRLEGEIDDLLRRLGQLTADMSAIESESARTANAALLQRFREVLRDDQRFFQKVRTSIRRKRESAELFRDVNESRDRMKAETEELLRERGAIGRSARMTDEILEQAVATRAEALGQRRVFTAASSRLAQIGTVFPGAKVLIRRIADKKTRDDTIVALLIAFLIAFTLWWKLLR
jgi:Golgi SNAP receptor complex protein 1